MKHLELMYELGMIHDVVRSRLRNGRREYAVFTEDASRRLSRWYATRAEAVRRLRQIEFFKNEG